MGVETMSLEEIKANFFGLMEEIVTTYGDDQEEERQDEEEVAA